MIIINKCMKTKCFVLRALICIIGLLSLTGCELFNAKSSESTSEYSASQPSSYSKEQSQSKSSEIRYDTNWSYDDKGHWLNDLEGLGLKKNEEQHIFTTKTLAATYFSKGKVIYTCQKCGYSYEEETEILVHKYDEEYSHDAQKHWHACSDTGYSNLKKDEEPHDFEVQTIAPSYTEEGRTIYTCKTCKYSYETKSNKLEHHYDTNWDHDETKHWHNCTDEGFVSLKKDEGNHRFFVEKTNATYETEEVTTYTCQDCGYCYSETTGGKLEHNFSKLWSNDENHHWHACIDKGFETVKGDYDEHDFDAVTTPATFTSQGYTTYTCKDCGFSYVGDYTEIFDHEFSNEYAYDDFGHWHRCVDEGYENEQGDYELHDFDVVKVDPNFENDGSITYSCSICGYTYTEKQGDKLEHNYSEEWSNDKTHHWHACTDEGYEDKEKGDYALHNFAKKSIPATYEHEGTSTFTCKTCGYTYTALDNEQLEHTFAEDYTVDENGHWHACLDDGYANYKPDYEDHDYDLFVTPATIDKKGENLYKCKTCGYEYSEEIASLMEQSIASLKFTLNSDGESYSVSRYVGPATEIYIPDTFNGLPVTGIYDYIFQNSNITFLKMNSNISELPWGIIYGCQTIETFDVGNSVTYYSVGTWNTNSLRKVILGDKINSISSGSFPLSVEEIVVSDNNTNYMSEEGLVYSKDGMNLIVCPKAITGDVEVKDGVQQISSYAFQNCENIKSITIPSSVNYIEYGAFQYCTNMETITFNNNIGSFENEIFTGSTKLKEINISEDNPYLKKIGGVIYNSSLNQIVKGPLAYEGSFVIPDSVNYLSDGAFENIEGLTEVTIPSTIKYLSNYCFRNCTSLKTVNSMAEEVSIYSSCFYNCSSLEYFNTIGSVVYISYDGFSHCASLKEAPIDENTRIYGQVFSGCNSLNFTEENNCRYLPLGENTHYFLYEMIDKGKNSVSISTNCHTIMGTAFRYSSLISVEIPSNVKEISYEAFYNCSNLKTVILNEGLEIIGEYAFAYSYNLTEIALPSTLVSLGYNVFANENIKEIIVPESCTSLSESAFAYSQIEKVTILNPDSYIKVEGNCIVTNEKYNPSWKYLYYYFYKSDYVIIPDKIEGMDWGAFGSDWEIDAIYCETPYGSGTPNWMYNSVSNSYFNDAPRYFYSETYQEGCWRYVDGVPTLW